MIDFQSIHATMREGLFNVAINGQGERCKLAKGKLASFIIDPTILVALSTEL